MLCGIGVGIHIIDDVCGVLNCMQSWYIGHVSRKVNFDVHRLIKTVVKQVMDQIWME
jgi:hypothetical protein